jgi:hypothetical protein
MDNLIFISNLPKEDMLMIEKRNRCTESTIKRRKTKQQHYHKDKGKDTYLIVERR